MTPDRAALREIAERFGNMELEESDRNYGVSGLTLYDMIALCRDYLARTAPLLVTCPLCVAGVAVDYGITPDEPCSACHGKGSVEREDIAEIRKRFEDAPHSKTCNANRHHLPGHTHYETDRGEECPPWHFGTGPCAEDCWKSTFGLDALLDLVAAQAREIAELEETNETL